MAGHVEFCGHLVVLGVAGHFAAVEIVGPEVVLVESRVRAKVPRSGGGYAECGEIKDESPCCSVERPFNLSGESARRHETSRAAEPHSRPRHYEGSEGTPFLVGTATTGNGDCIEGVLMRAADINFV